MYEIEVLGEFFAGHALTLYDGSVETKHEHLWKVSVVMRCRELDRIGVVFDFETLKPALKKVLSDFDHADLCEHPVFKSTGLNSSTENIAKVIYDRLRKEIPSTGDARIVKVTVWETPDGNASYVAEN